MTIQNPNAITTDTSPVLAYDSMMAVGRIILVIMFLQAGLQKFGNLDGTAAYIASKGLPMPYIMGVLAAITEVVAPLLIIVGFQTRLAAIWLLIFTAVATYLFHDYWNMTDAAQKSANQLSAMKNLSVIGAFLMLAATGAGRWSIDGRRG